MTKAFLDKEYGMRLLVNHKDLNLETEPVHKDLVLNTADLDRIAVNSHIVMNA